jgi:hypothetical protein
MSEILINELTTDYDVFIRAKVNGKYQNVNLMDLTEKQFRIVLLNMLIKQGLFVGVVRNEDQ